MHMLTTGVDNGAQAALPDEQTVLSSSNPSTSVPAYSIVTGRGWVGTMVSCQDHQDQSVSSKAKEPAPSLPSQRSQSSSSKSGQATTTATRATGKQSGGAQRNGAQAADPGQPSATNNQDFAQILQGFDDFCNSYLDRRQELSLMNDDLRSEVAEEKRRHADLCEYLTLQQEQIKVLKCKSEALEEKHPRQIASLKAGAQQVLEQCSGTSTIP